MAALPSTCCPFNVRLATLLDEEPITTAQELGVKAHLYAQHAHHSHAATGSITLIGKCRSCDIDVSTGLSRSLRCECHTHSVRPFLCPWSCKCSVACIAWKKLRCIQHCVALTAVVALESKQLVCPTLPSAPSLGHQRHAWIACVRPHFWPGTSALHIMGEHLECSVCRRGHGVVLDCSDAIP